ncbi:hypothetical protein POTOM_016398 [Populus tomentosa]|uniref:Uncharacterized protein n=1 Tax=Populus tomentosa TaxID=118781 RepID=A0A8X8CXY6_POPTO|nr:hypothetical protein POTOM_016398 [Populus tomentosa]
MEVLVEKKLSQTDIKYRLAFPTNSLRAFPMPEGETAVYFEAADTLENEWNFRLSIRGENDHWGLASICAKFGFGLSVWDVIAGDELASDRARCISFPVSCLFSCLLS